MRCPTCGTENTPDSRFCGGCGAKLQHSEVRVAPTAKIPDDAPFSPPSVPPGQHAYSPSTYGGGPVSYAPPSMPPRVAPERPPSVAPNDTRMPSAPPRVAEASLALEAPPRRTGLIATVLVLDLALAAAGAVLLAKGLEKPPVRTAPPPPTAPTNPIEVTPAPAAPAPPPKPAADPAGSASITLPDLGSASTSPAPAPTKPPAPPTRTPTPPVKHDPAPHEPTPHEPTPQDPYDAAHALSNEVELQSDRTHTDFNRCLDQALQIAPVHGAIRISFDVGGDGRVVKVKAVQNTTGAGGLATCLISTIAGWSFATHPNHPMTFVRPFTYP